MKSNLDNAFDPQFPLGIIIGLDLTGAGGGGGDGSSGTGECRYDQSNFDNCTFSN